MTLFLFMGEQQASNFFLNIHYIIFLQELTIQNSGAHLGVAIISESFVHVYLAFLDTIIEYFIKQVDYKSCSF